MQPKIHLEGNVDKARNISGLWSFGRLWKKSFERLFRSLIGWLIFTFMGDVTVWHLPTSINFYQWKLLHWIQFCTSIQHGWLSLFWENWACKDGALPRVWWISLFTLFPLLPQAALARCKLPLQAVKIEPRPSFVFSSPPLLCKFVPVGKNQYQSDTLMIWWNSPRIILHPTVTTRKQKMRSGLVTK